jgi:cytoskeleton-associated protein 5
LQDPNVIVLLLAIDIIDKMGAGLKTSFGQYKNILLPPLLDRTKEKKQNILEALRRALDTLFSSLNRIGDIVEDVSSFFVHANPNVKKESIDFFTRCLQKTKVNSDIGKNETKTVAEKLLKGMEDSAPDVRDSSASALAAMVKRYSERTMAPYLERLDKAKSQKVLELLNAKNVSKAPTQKPQPVQPVKPNNSPPAAKRTLETAKTRTPTVSKSTVAGSMKPKSLNSSRQNSSSSVAQEEIVIKFEFSDETATDYVQTLFEENELKDLNEGNWKLRLAALHNLLSKLNDIKDVKPEGIIRYLLKTITWKENNFQIMTVMVNVIQNLARKETGFNPACASLVAGGLVDKLGDMKIKKVAGVCLDMVLECSSVELVFGEAYKSIRNMKSPKIIADSLLWMNQVLKDFGIAGVNLKVLIDFAKTFFDHATAPVRSNAVSIFVTLHLLGKTEIRSVISDAPNSVLSNFDSEIAKSGAQKIVPIRAQAVVTSMQSSTESLIPKSDLNAKIPSELFQQLGDGNWKERKAGLEELSKIVEGCHGSIQPNLSSDLITALKQRIADSNKNLSMMAVEICGNLANSIGKPFDRYVKTFIGPMIALLADQKQSIRSTVLGNIEKIVQTVGLGSVLQNIALALNQDQPQIRKDLLKYLADKRQDLLNEVAEIQILISPIFCCLQDRNSDVRKLGQTLLGILSEVVDVQTLRTKASDAYQGAQLSSLLPYLDSLGSADSPKPPPKTFTPRSPPQDQKKGPKVVRPVANLKKEPGSSESLLSEANQPVLCLDSKGKEQRMQQDRGVLKWIFDSPRRELIDLLTEQAVSTFSRELHELLFSTNHYKEKDILAGLKLLDTFLTEATDMERATFLQVVVSNADLILKYLTIRFFDTNTSILLKCFDVLEHLLLLLDEAGYLLNEYEANSFLPFFINKMGDPKETMRIKMRSIAKQIGRVYPVSKLFVYLMKGLDSKNSRTRVECLDELTALVQRNGQGVFVPSKCVGQIASQVGDRDASVRNSALNLICQIHSVLEEDISQYFSKLSEKEKDLINERIKRLPGSKIASTTAKAPVRKLPAPAARVGTPVKEKNNENLLLSPGLPVVKQFALDFDKLDSMIPKKEQREEGAIDIPTQFQPPSFPSSLDEGLEARVDIIIQQISAMDIDTNLEGARHLEKLLIAHPNHDIVRSTDIVAVINSVSQIAFSNLNARDPLNIRLCKLYTTILVHIFSSKESAALVPYSSMEDCVRKVLVSLVDPDLQALDSTKSLPRALNMLMVRMIDNCEPNRVFRSISLTVDHCCSC